MSAATQWPLTGELLSAAMDTNQSKLKDIRKKQRTTRCRTLSCFSKTAWYSSSNEEGDRARQARGASSCRPRSPAHATLRSAPQDEDSDQGRCVEEHRGRRSSVSQPPAQLVRLDTHSDSGLTFVVVSMFHVSWTTTAWVASPLLLHGHLPCLPHLPGSARLAAGLGLAVAPSGSTKQLTSLLFDVPLLQTCRTRSSRRRS